MHHSSGACENFAPSFTIKKTTFKSSNTLHRYSTSAARVIEQLPPDNPGRVLLFSFALKFMAHSAERFLKFGSPSGSPETELAAPRLQELVQLAEVYMRLEVLLCASTRHSSSVGVSDQSDLGHALGGTHVPLHQSSSSLIPSFHEILLTSCRKQAVRDRSNADDAPVSSRSASRRGHSSKPASGEATRMTVPSRAIAHAFHKARIPERIALHVEAVRLDAKSDATPTPREWAPILQLLSRHACGGSHELLIACSTEDALQALTTITTTTTSATRLPSPPRPDEFLAKVAQQTYKTLHFHGVLTPQRRESARRVLLGFVADVLDAFEDPVRRPFDVLVEGHKQLPNSSFQTSAVNFQHSQHRLEQALNVLHTSALIANALARVCVEVPELDAHLKAACEEAVGVVVPAAISSPERRFAGGQHAAHEILPRLLQSVALLSSSSSRAQNSNTEVDASESSDASANDSGRNVALRAQLEAVLGLLEGACHDVHTSPALLETLDDQSLAMMCGAAVTCGLPLSDFDRIFDTLINVEPDVAKLSLPRNHACHPRPAAVAQLFHALGLETLHSSAEAGGASPGSGDRPALLAYLRHHLAGGLDAMLAKHHKRPCGATPPDAPRRNRTHPSWRSEGIQPSEVASVCRSLSRVARAYPKTKSSSAHAVKCGRASPGGCAFRCRRLTYHPRGYGSVALMKRIANLRCLRVRVDRLNWLTLPTSHAFLCPCRIQVLPPLRIAIK